MRAHRSDHTFVKYVASRSIRSLIWTDIERRCIMRLAHFDVMNVGHSLAAGERCRTTSNLHTIKQSVISATNVALALFRAEIFKHTTKARIAEQGARGRMVLVRQVVINSEQHQAPLNWASRTLCILVTAPEMIMVTVTGS